MALATEMTLTLGRTAYGGDPEDDERIEGREVRISVTWRLTEEEQDLPVMASALAEEAGRALLEAERNARTPPMIEKSPGINGSSIEAETERPPAQRQPPVTQGGPVSSLVTATGSVPTAGGTTDGNGNGHVNGNSYVPDSGAPSGIGHADRSGGRTPTGGTASAPVGASTYPRAYVPGITKTQQLAIEAYCTRHGVADWEVRRLIWTLFAKKEPRELNKDQAGELLTALQQATLENGTENPIYAN